MRFVLALLALPLLADQTSKERVLGERLAKNIKQESKVVEDATVLGYVRAVGSHLIANLEDSPHSYTLDVIVNDETAEPTVLPGGWILVPVSFIVNAENEDEFAGMIAHAIAHLETQQSHSRQAGALAEGLVSVPIIFVAGQAGLHAASTGSGRIPRGFLESQRLRELESDKLGIELARRAGYDPSGFRRYLDRTQPGDTKLSPVPSRKLRFSNIDEVLRSLSATPTASEQFQRVRQRAHDLLGETEQSRRPTLRRR